MRRCRVAKCHPSVENVVGRKRGKPSCCQHDGVEHEHLPPRLGVTIDTLHGFGLCRLRCGFPAWRGKEIELLAHEVQAALCRTAPRVSSEMPNASAFCRTAPSVLRSLRAMAGAPMRFLAIPSKIRISLGSQGRRSGLRFITNSLFGAGMGFSEPRPLRKIE